MSDSNDRSEGQARPSGWVERFATGFAAGGEVLDIACGSGRNFPPLLGRGARVLGVDRDIGEARMRWSGTAGVRLVEEDLETGAAPPFSGQRFAGVVVTNYLWRPLLADIVAAVQPDGLLLYETFMVGQGRLGRPRRAEFLLRPGELLAAVEGRLVVVAFEHVRLGDPDRVVQRIAAVGPGHRWPGSDVPGS